MKWLTDVLDATGIYYIEDGWAPMRPPNDAPCCVYHDEIVCDGPDECVSWSVHSVTVDLYDDGDKAGRAARKAIANALKDAGIKFSTYEPTYIYSEKKYMTVFYLEDHYEKE